MSLQTQYKEIITKAEKANAKTAAYFHSSIIIAWPVATGFSRGAWRIKKEGGGLSVSNDVSYSGVLWNGRVLNGTWRGSVQMPQGGLPILKASLLKFPEFYKGS